MPSKADLDQAVERLEHVIAQSIGAVDRRVDKH